MIPLLIFCCCVALLWALTERHLRNVQKSEHAAHLANVQTLAERDKQAAAELAARYVADNATAAEALEKLKNEHPPLADALPSAVLAKAKKSRKN